MWIRRNILSLVHGRYCHSYIFSCLAGDALCLLSDMAWSIETSEAIEDTRTTGGNVGLEICTSEKKICNMKRNLFEENLNFAFRVTLSDYTISDCTWKLQFSRFCTISLTSHIVEEVHERVFWLVMNGSLILQVVRTFGMHCSFQIFKLWNERVLNLSKK